LSAGARFLHFLQLGKSFNKRFNVAFKSFDILFSDHCQFFVGMVVDLVFEEAIKAHEEAASEALSDAGLCMLITINNIHSGHSLVFKLSIVDLCYIRRISGSCFGY